MLCLNQYKPDQSHEFRLLRLVGGRQIHEGVISLQATYVGFTVSSKPFRFSRMMKDFPFYHNILCSETMVTV